MEPAGQHCPRCGGNLEFRHTVESYRTGAPVDIFRCEDCGHVHTVECRTKMRIHLIGLPRPKRQQSASGPK
jgi:uncharacterized Zn finger protein